ncbi:hypothetical protein AB1E18_009602 [Capra hircus]
MDDLLQPALQLEQPGPRPQPEAQSLCEEPKSLLSGEGRRSGSTDKEAEDSRPRVGTLLGTRARPLQCAESLDHFSTLHLRSLRSPRPAALLPTKLHDCNRQACPASSCSTSSFRMTGLLIHPIPIFYK